MSLMPRYRSLSPSTRNIHSLESYREEEELPIPASRERISADSHFSIARERDRSTTFLAHYTDRPPPALWKQWNKGSSNFSKSNLKNENTQVNLEDIGELTKSLNRDTHTLFSKETEYSIRMVLYSSENFTTKLSIPQSKRSMTISYF